MSTTITPQTLTALARLSTSQLRAKYAELFGQPTRSGNRDWLMRKIAWRMQANAGGGLSDRAKQRAAELASEADLRYLPPREARPSSKPAPVKTVPVPVPSDRRLPPAGTILTREFRGHLHEVKVLAEGFEYAGQVFASLSAVANAISGSHTNGFRFFGLN